MGNDVSANVGPLQNQLQAPLVAIDPRFITQEEVYLVLKEKFSFSGDDFSIHDTNGRHWFQVKGKTFSLRDKKTLFDVANVPVLTMHSKVFSLHSTQEIYRGQSTDLAATVKKKIKLSFNSSITVTVTYQGRTEILEIKGNFMDRAFIIMRGGQLIAKSTRTNRWGAAALLTDRETYFLEVAAGVDSALMVALAVSIDEIERES
ncbi:hypothetical protein BSKO_00286 [Bryopsis sp. KO-2023]|nr:hypothetical protein BSKO_00286 [Bryopsis sp. KO-2023]